MCDPLRSLLQFLGGLNWLAIVQCAIGIWMACIAKRALHTWKRQIKAKKLMEFIDTFTDTIHDFVLSMSAPVHCVALAKMGIDSYAKIGDKAENTRNAAAVAYIEAEGKSNGDRIQRELGLARPFLSKMLSLVAKGQIFGIGDYVKCQDACKGLARSYHQVEDFSKIIGNPYWNWEDPAVQQAIDTVLSIDHQDIDKNLTDQNVKFLLFAKEAYRILK